MPTITVEGRKVNVGEEFFRLSPEEQDATVDEIAGSLSAPAAPTNEAGMRPSSVGVPQSRLTEEDRASPLPDDLIEGGKAIIADSEKNSWGGDLARSLGTGIRQGTESLIGAFGDTNRITGDIAGWAAGKMGASEETQDTVRGIARNLSPTAMLPSTGDVRTITTPVIGENYEPQSTSGEYVRNIGKFVPAAAMGPGRVLTKVASGLGGALASETAGQIYKGSAAEPYARAAAALVGGAAGGAAASFFGLGRTGGATAETIAKAVKGATPAQLDDAERLFMEAQTAGAPITRFEAIQQVTKGGTRAGDVQRVVEGQGGLRDFMSKRPGQVEATAAGQMDTLAPASAAPSTIGPTIGAAAEEVVNDARSVINRVTKPFYDRAAQTPLPASEFAKVKAAPGWEEASKAIRSDPQLARYVDGMPDNSVGFLNEVQKYLTSQADNAAGPVNAQKNMQRSAGYGSDAGMVRDAAKAASDDFKQAVNSQADLRKQYLDPLLDGPLGKIASSDTTTKQAIEALFPRNPLPNSAAEIGRTIKALSLKRPSVARQLVRAHVESVFNQTTRDLQGGANQWGGAGFRATLVGNKQQAENLEAAIRALPQGDDVWTGFNRYLDIMEAQGQRQRPGSQTSFNNEMLQDLKTGNAVATGAAVASGGFLQWPRKALDVVERWRLGRNVSEISDLITDPKSRDLFRNIATSKGNQARNLAVSLTLMGGAGAQSTPAVSPKN